MGCAAKLPEENAAILALLKTCAKTKDLRTAEKIHAVSFKKGLLQTDIFIGNALVSLYGKCGLVVKSRKVFNELPIRNVVSWTALISAYAQHGHCKEALHCFDQMLYEGFTPDAFTYACILKACGDIKAIEKGLRIHADVQREGLVEINVLVGTALVDMYAKCGALSTAQKVFDQLPIRNVVSWTSLISGFTQHGCGEEALGCYKKMEHEGLSPNVVTFTCILKACATVGNIKRGKEIHAFIDSEGLLERNVVLGTALIDMYAKCNALGRAHEVFNKLQGRNVFSWTALIAGYAQHGNGEEALALFEKMQRESFPPNEVTFACILKACGSVRGLDKGKQIHADINRGGFLGKDLLIGNALIDMYSKCGAVEKALEVFNALPAQDVVSWTALIAGHVQHGNGEEALNCFEGMVFRGVVPNAITLLCVLNACSNLGAADKGKEVHSEIVRKGLLDKHTLLGNALVDMYVKCGSLMKAQEVFNELSLRDVAAWTALIAGYAQLGMENITIDLFGKMLSEGMKPNAMTITVILNACSHSGLLEKCHECYANFSTYYGITPSLEHYACMVDLLSRAGRFEETVMLIKKMPVADYPPIWNALLGASQRWGNLNLGGLAFERAIQLNGNDAAPYICMRNMYVAASMQEDAVRIETLRIENEAWEENRCSWSSDAEEEKWCS